MRYLDSPSSLPIWCDIREYRARLAMLDADLYEVLYAGKGFEAMISSPLHGIESDFDERWFEIAYQARSRTTRSRGAAARPRRSTISGRSSAGVGVENAKPCACSHPSSISRVSWSSVSTPSATDV